MRESNSSHRSSNRSTNVFKRFFRSNRISLTTNNSGVKSPVTHPRTTATSRNIETGDGKGKKGCRCGPFHLFSVWDNAYSIKLLGSRNAVEKEEMRRQALPYFIIHPCSKFK